MKKKGRNLIVVCQLFVVLAFFVGVFMNYYSFDPIIYDGESARIAYDLDAYTDQFYFENDCDVRDPAQRDSVLAMNLDPFDGDLFILDSEGNVIYAQDGTEGNAIGRIRRKYGKTAAELLNEEYSFPRDRSRTAYDDDTHMSFYASYIVSRDLMFFYAVDYWVAGKEYYKVYYKLLHVMMLGGLLVILISFFVIRKIFTQDHKESLVRQELETAATIQKSMLPHGEKHMIQLDVDARLVPARAVGGDFYSFMLKEGLLYFCIGDVSGKGVPSSLFMSKAVTLFRILSKSMLSPSELASGMNAELCMNNEHNMFITGIVGTMRASDGFVTYVNAGHELPVVWDGLDGSSLSYLEPSRNLPFGVMPEFEYVEQTYEIRKNGMLMMYTDGVSEAKSGRKGFLGRDAILRLLEPFKALTSKEINDSVLGYLSDFESGHEQSDDITLLTFRNIGMHKHLVIRNEVADLSKIGAFTDEIFKECVMSNSERVQVRAGLDEAVTNCVHYAYDEPGNEIDIAATIEQGKLVFTVKDRGKPFNPMLHIPELSNELQVGGLGISMYKAIFDDVAYIREDGQNILKLIKIL